MSAYRFWPVCLLLYAALMPQGGEAQAGPTRCSFDTAGKSDTITVAYSLMPEILSSADSVDRLAYLFYAQTIGEHFSPPKALTLAYLPTRHASASPTMDDFGLGGRLLFKLDSHGHIKLPISAGTTAPELNEALAKALLEADSAGALSPPPETAEFAEGLVRLQIQAARERPPLAVPLMRARLRVLLVDLPPRLKSAKPPKYPKNAMYAGVSSRVVFRFVVDETGRVIPSTIQVVEAKYREFIEAAVVSVQDAKFAPAEINGCAVPMQLELPVWFKVGQ